MEELCRLAPRDKTDRPIVNLNNARTDMADNVCLITVNYVEEWFQPPTPPAPAGSKGKPQAPPKQFRVSVVITGITKTIDNNLLQTQTWIDKYFTSVLRDSELTAWDARDESNATIGWRIEGAQLGLNTDNVAGAMMLYAEVLSANNSLTVKIYKDSKKSAPSLVASGSMASDTWLAHGKVLPFDEVNKSGLKGLVAFDETYTGQPVAQIALMVEKPVVAAVQYQTGNFWNDGEKAEPNNSGVYTVFKVTWQINPDAARDYKQEK
jgi:hypothetical protein